MQIPDFSHITNQNDPVPNVPPHILDFEHPEGELHITNVDGSTGDATMVACPGSENTVSGSFCPVCRDAFGFLRCGGTCLSRTARLATRPWTPRSRTTWARTSTAFRSAPRRARSA